MWKKSYDILILVADSYSLTPDEKIRITHWITEWKISTIQQDHLLDILLKEQRVIWNRQLWMINKVISKASNYETKKYLHLNIWKLTYYTQLLQTQVIKMKNSLYEEDEATEIEEIFESL